MPAILVAAVENALGGMKGGPMPLPAAVSFHASQLGGEVGDLDLALAKRLNSDANDEVRKALHNALSEWDWVSEASWIRNTKPNTPARRTLIHTLLKLGSQVSDLIDEKLPFYEVTEGTIIEAEDAKGTWYTAAFKKDHDFYWTHLKTYLLTKGFAPNAVNAVDAATTKVLERLGDPAAQRTRAARGLVVGYVQSGKTTNFTGVMAKAIDAGYRLIIVLSGTTNLLRNQTQRRIDLELVGRENILRGGRDGEVQHDYMEDLAWKKGKFISYGAQPSLLGKVDITRLTGLVKDFSAPDTGINPVDFQFEKRNRRRPLWDRENLDHAGARIAVVKKQKDRLAKLLRELKAIGDASCAEIPALIIDDESDQASVDTLNPAKKKSVDERTSINNCIVKLLGQLKRAQYVGYTATPFANVFVNLDDPADIYPKDFIFSLNPPDGYMGARNFHDFGDRRGAMSNEAAHVRGITSEKDDRLEEALDAFVLTAALKVFREKDPNTYPHHTMLVHASPLKDAHLQMKDRLVDLWNTAGYDSVGPGVGRLKSLFEGDFKDVWEARGRPLGERYPASFDQLKKPLGIALERIRTGSSPVLMVNSAEGAEVPDFKEPVDWDNGNPGVWKVIVGGAKLSRGYTVEGLTVSHFQRPARMQDTLMQMGRWFGYRAGYRDLVRLYIGRAVSAGKGKELDLYSAFESVCRDEESFREQLSIYERNPDGSPGITPRDVPALVFNSHPRLRPTAKNKMFNAELTYAAFTHREPTSQASSGAGVKANAKLVKSLLDAAGLKKGAASGFSSFDFYWTTLDSVAVIKTLKSFKWEQDDAPLSAEIEYLEKEASNIKSWLVLLPQLKEEAKAGRWSASGRDLACVGRSMVSETRFKVFSTPEHVQFAKWLVGDEDAEAFTAGPLKARSDRGVLVLYPTRKILDRKIDVSTTPVMAFFLTAPLSVNSKRVAFRVRSRAQKSAAVVDVAPQKHGRKTAQPKKRKKADGRE